MVKVMCKNCGKEYDLEKGDKPSDFQCECGGNLRYLKLDNDFNFIDFFRFFDISSKENLIRLKYIGKNQDFIGSVIIGVLFSMFVSVIFLFLSTLGLSSVLHSFPINILPLFSAGIVAAYVFKGQDIDLFKTSAVAGVISAILNAIGNLFMIMLFNPLFFYELSLISIIIFMFIYGGILGLLGGFIIYLYKKVIM